MRLCRRLVVLRRAQAIRGRHRQLKQKYAITSTTNKDKIIVWNGFEIQRLSAVRIRVAQVAKIREMACEYATQLSTIKGKALTPECAEGDHFNPSDMIDLKIATKHQLAIVRQYQQMVGSAMYVACGTRFDIAYKSDCEGSSRRPSK